jgi:hypothetical protein
MLTAFVALPQTAVELLLTFRRALVRFRGLL